MFYGGPIFALGTGHWWGWLAFFSSGAVGALSHALPGDGRVDVRESTSSPRVVFYVTVMFWHIARGQDIAAANTRYAQIKTRS